MNRKPAARQLTREEWLEAAIEILRPMFAQLGWLLPMTIHVSVGFGFGTKAESKHIAGQTTHTSMSADGANHVFVSPEVDDTAYILGLLIHELGHVALDNEDGHTGRFAEIMGKFGMEAPLTEVHPDAALLMELGEIAKELGEYRHAKLDMQLLRAPQKVGPDGKVIGPRTTSGPKAQTNRHQKVACRSHPEYSVRASRTVLALGMPACGICGDTMDLA